MDKYKLESMVNDDGICLFQILGNDRLIGFGSFHVGIATEYFASILILKDKLNAAGYVDISDMDIKQVKAIDKRGWN